MMLCSAPNSWLNHAAQLSTILSLPTITTMFLFPPPHHHLDLIDMESSTYLSDDLDVSIICYLLSLNRTAWVCVHGYSKTTELGEIVVVWNRFSSMDVPDAL